MAQSFNLSSPAVSTPRRVRPSNMAESKSLPLSHQVIGFGPRSGCCQSTICMDHGLLLERSILSNPEETTTRMHKVATTSFLQPSTGDQTHADDAWWRTNVKRNALHTTYASSEHLFGLEWSQKYLFTYVDSRLLQVLYTNFDQPLWQRGNFPIAGVNGTRLVDVWSSTGRDDTPFDQEFYLILDVGVGGTNGWFQDGASGKPWVDTSARAKYDFWKAKDQWLPTWQAPGAGQMTISKVQMWQQCDGNEAST